MRMRKICGACYRHVCPCGWYKVLSRRFVGVAECGRCLSSDRVTVREVAHYNAGMDDERGYRDVVPAVRHACQFCERVRDEVLMDYVEGEGWECKDARRCEEAQHGAELDALLDEEAA